MTLSRHRLPATFAGLGFAACLAFATSVPAASVVARATHPPHTTTTRPTDNANADPTSVPASPAETSPPALTLAQALALAEAAHPDLVEAQALVRAAGGRIQQAGARPNPEAILRMENAPLAGRVTGDADYLAGLGLTIPLADHRGRAMRVEELDRQRLQFDAQSRRLELRRRVHGAFAQALYQQEASRLRSELLAAAEQAVRVTRARVDASDAVPADLARVEAEWSGARSEWRRSDLLRLQACTELAATLGQPADGAREVQGSLSTTLELPLLEDLSRELATHPALAAADADLLARTAAVESAKAARVPDLKAELLYRRIESERQDAFDVGFSLPLPLFDRGRGRLREAEGQRDAAEARRRATRTRLQSNLREAHTDLQAALEEARALETEILPRLTDIRRATEARYTAGDLGLSETLTVRREDAAVRLRYLETLRDVMLAWARLQPFLRPSP